MDVELASLKWTRVKGFIDLLDERDATKAILIGMNQHHQHLHENKENKQENTGLLKPQQGED